jgi:hypothetical protein
VITFVRLELALRGEHAEALIIAAPQPGIVTTVPQQLPDDGSEHVDAARVVRSRLHITVDPRGRASLRSGSLLMSSALYLDDGALRMNLRKGLVFAAVALALESGGAR